MKIDVRVFSSFAIALIVEFIFSINAQAEYFYVTPDQNTYHEGQVLAGNLVNVANTYKIQVPVGQYAKVGIDYGRFMWRNCETAQFTAKLSGYGNLKAGTYVELTSSATLKVSLTAIPDVYTKSDNISGYFHIANVAIPHYYPTYHRYANYYASQGYVFSVSYRKKLPDLYVSSAALSLPAVAVDEAAVVSYDICNGGWLNSGTESLVRIFDDSQQIVADSIVPALERHGSATYKITLPKLKAGLHDIRIVADATGNITEDSESNNEVHLSLRVYERTPVNVTYNLNGAGTEYAVSVIAGNTIGKLPDVNRVGYTFEGWWTAASDGIQIDSTEKITESRKFYAHWNANVTQVALNRQYGGQGTRVIAAVYDQPMPRITLPIRNGFVFEGYWSEPEGQGVQYYSATGASVRKWDIDAAQMSLYAKWTGCNIDIALQQRGGIGGDTSVVAEYSQMLPTVVVPSLSNWVFQGYYSETNGLGRQYYDANGVGLEFCRFTSNTNLYAHWLPTKMDYLLTLDNQGGTGSEAVTVTYAQKMPAVAIPNRDQYVFCGYFSMPDGGGSKYYNYDGSPVVCWDSVSIDRLYAKWEKAYHVVLDGNGAAMQRKIQYFTSNRWELVRSPFTRAGLSFCGWTLSPDGSPMFPDGAVLSKEVLGYGDDPESEEVTLYAVWGNGIVSPFSDTDGVTFYTGGNSKNGDWMIEDNTLRSSSTCENSWLCAVFDGCSDFSMMCTNAVFDTAFLNFTFFTDEYLYTNRCVDGIEKHISISDGHHLVTWAFEKNLSNSGWNIRLEDYGGATDETVLRQIIAEKESQVSSLEEEVANIAILVCSGYSAAKIREAVKEAFDDLADNESVGYLRYHVADLIINKVGTNKLRAAVKKYDDNGIDVGSIKRYEECCEEASSLLHDIVGIESYMAAFATLTQLSWCEKHQVIFSERQVSDQQSLQDMYDAIQRLWLVYDETVKYFTSIATYMLTVGTSLSDDKRELCSQMIENCCNNCWSDGNVFLRSALDSQISSSNIGLTTVEYRKAMNGSSSTPEAVQLRKSMANCMTLLSDKETLLSCIEEEGVIDMRTIAKNGFLGVLPTPDSRPGYSFSGWQRLGDPVQVTPQTVVECDMFLMASWATNQYTVSFETAGGDAIESWDIWHGERLGLLPVPMREGYSFEGWYTDLSGNLAVDTEVSITANTKLYAQWTRIYDVESIKNSDMEKSGVSVEWKGSDACEISLADAGWHLVSFSALPDDPSPANVFASVVDKIDQVVSGSKAWRPTAGGRLTELQIGVGYWVRTSVDGVSWSIYGASDPDVEISLSKGWNLVGYPFLENGDTATVLKSAFDAGKVSKIVDGSKVYPGRLTTLEPGKGYWFYAPAECTITFDGN